MSDRKANEQAVFDAVSANWNASREQLLEAMTEALHTHFSHYTGVYIYLLEGELLVLSNFRGRPTEHTRIPIGEGICGRAARVKDTVTVDDVTVDVDYIACSLETRSEIVVPILHGETVFGTIDIDSDVPGAFSAEDRAFLQELARRIVPKISASPSAWISAEAGRSSTDLAAGDNLIMQDHAAAEITFP